MIKEKFNIEYTLRSVAPAVLWNYIATANGLAHWFADDVQLSGKHYTFFWNKMPQDAFQVGCRNGVFIRFRWNEEEEQKTFFEFRIHQLELTGSTILEVTDYAFPDEKEDSIELWNTQIDNLKRKLGI
ncbi:MAG: START-like domain-containing protein [Bacteroidales bacterium]